MPRPVTRALGEFGFAYGMAFQIVDDILDLVATESQLGKPAGNDLAEGTYTLPVIRALADPVAGDELRSLLGQPIGAAARDRAAELVRSTTGVDEARDTARMWADKAQAALTSPARHPRHQGAAAGRGPVDRDLGPSRLRGRGPRTPRRPHLRHGSVRSGTGCRRGCPLDRTAGPQPAG